MQIHCKYSTESPVATWDRGFRTYHCREALSGSVNKDKVAAPRDPEIKEISVK